MRIWILSLMVVRGFEVASVRVPGPLFAPPIHADEEPAGSVKGRRR